MSVLWGYPGWHSNRGPFLPFGGLGLSLIWRAVTVTFRLFVVCFLVVAVGSEVLEGAEH